MLKGRMQKWIVNNKSEIYTIMKCQIIRKGQWVTSGSSQHIQQHASFQSGTWYAGAKSVWWGPNGFGSNKIFNNFLNYSPHLYIDTYLQFYLYQTGLVPTKPIWWGPNRFGPHHRGFISVFHLGRDLSGWGVGIVRECFGTFELLKQGK